MVRSRLALFSSMLMADGRRQILLEPAPAGGVRRRRRRLPSIRATVCSLVAATDAVAMRVLDQRARVRRLFEHPAAHRRC